MKFTARARRRCARFLPVLAALALVGTSAVPVAAAPPGNDLPDGATMIPALPFSIDQDTTEATTTGDDVGCGAGGLDAATVWYAFTPVDDVRVEVDSSASDYLVGVNLFIEAPTEDGRADCNNDRLAFDASAGTTYYLLFADVNDDGENGGHLAVEVREAPPPIEITVHVDPRAKSHPKTGQVLLTGSITCDRPAEFAEISATLRLDTGRFTTVGAGAASTACGPAPTRWSTIVDGENDRFRGGLAEAQLLAFACDALTCTEAADEASVRLRRGVFPLPEPEPEPEARSGQRPPGTLAAAPANDDIGSPAVIGGLPFTDNLDTSGATTGATDPGYCFDPTFGQDPASVWYAFTATSSGPLLATTFESDYDTTLYVGTANGAGGIDVIGCSDDTRTRQSAVRFDADAGETYLFAASASPFGEGVGGNLVFNLDVGPPAQVVELHVDRRGSFTGYGAAILRGTVNCTAPAPLGTIVAVEFSQRVGRRTLPGNAFVDITGCPAADIPFEAEVISPYGKYRGGAATAQVISAACSEFECGNQTVDLTVRLRH